MKTVTIMIPSYNQPDYIEQCVDSAIAQDYPNLDIIISDDSTNNEIEKIVREKYLDDSRIRLYKNKPSFGRVANYRENLYGRAKGDYVLNMDADDWLIDNSYISKAVDILDNNDDVVCVIGNQITFKQENNEFIDNRLNRTLNKINDGNELFLQYPDKKISINHLTNIYRRKDAIDIEFYRMDTRSADRESILRLILGKKVGYISGVSAVWRLHNNNYSNPHDKTVRYDDLKFIDSVYDFASKKQYFKVSVLNKWYRKIKFMDIYIIFYDSVRHFKVKQFLKLHYLMFKKDKKLLVYWLPYLIKTIAFDHILRRKKLKNDN